MPASAQRGVLSHSYKAPSGFTLLESLFMMLTLTVFAMLSVSLYRHQPEVELESEHKNWLQNGGDATVPPAAWTPAIEPLTTDGAATEKTDPLLNSPEDDM